MNRGRATGSSKGLDSRLGRAGKRLALAGLMAAGTALGMAGGAGPAVASDVHVNDYPTVARADYVFACMQVNGRTQEVLRKCSCSIDMIAELLPYSDYEEAETVMSIPQNGGERVSIFLSYQPLRDKVARLKKAQVEAELRCF